MPLYIAIAMFGNSAGFTVVYSCMQDVFPVMFCATAIGICNFTARLLTCFSAEVAELQPPLPMEMFSGISAGAILIIWFVRPMGQKTEKPTE
jgi:hypothetical protein